MDEGGACEVCGVRVPVGATRCWPDVYVDTVWDRHWDAEFWAIVSK